MGHEAVVLEWKAHGILETVFLGEDVLDDDDDNDFGNKHDDDPKTLP